MKHKLAVIANVHLLHDTQLALEKLLGQDLHFPSEDDKPDTEELVRRTGDAELVLVSPGTTITEEYLLSCPNVKYLGICGTSKENVDQAAAEKAGVEVTNVVDYGDEPTAEFIFMQLATLLRGMGKYQWRPEPRELMGKTIGIIGLGALGKAIAHVALAYKMNVLYFSRSRKQDWEERGVQYAEKPKLLRASDIVIISTPTNLEAIDKGGFSDIKTGSILVQASMGDCFDKKGFEEWIRREGNFALFDYSAGSDNYRLYKDMPRVMFPKVVAGHTFETKQRLGEGVIRNLQNYINRT